MNEFDFSALIPVVIPVRYGERDFVLKEADGEAAATYRNAAMKAARFVDGKVTNIEGLADVEALLVSLCLFEVKPDGSHGRLALGFVKSLPARMLKKLYEKAMEISDLNESGTDSRAQAMANALAHPDSPCSYQAMRDHIRNLVAADREQFGVLDKFLEDPKELAKN